VIRHVSVSRRKFIFVGALGIAAFAAVRYWPRSTAQSVPSRAPSADGDAILSAIVPVMLAGALPRESPTLDEAVRETVDNIDRAIQGLSPEQIVELGQLFAFLALAPIRWVLMQSTHSWRDATADEVGAFLARLRDSRIALLRAAYDALHQIAFAAWYGNPHAWPAMGYGGPPQLG
jgi:hypothetical protein